MNLTYIVMCQRFSPENFIKKVKKQGFVHYLFPTQDKVDLSLFEILEYKDTHILARDVNGEDCIIWIKKIILEGIDTDYLLFLYNDCEYLNIRDIELDEVYVGMYGDFIDEKNRYIYTEKYQECPVLLVKNSLYKLYGQQIDKHGIFFKQKEAISCLPKK